MPRRFAAVLLVVLAACSGSSTTKKGPDLHIQDVAAAVAAVEAQRPGSQYTEINMALEGVNLFVVTEPGRETPYLYAAGKLNAPAQGQSAEGEPFAVTGVPLDQAAKVSAFVTKEFKGSTITSVALVVVKPNGLVWAVRSQSARGGLLNSLFSPDGKMISALPAN
jgi:hypothetical protein